MSPEEPLKIPLPGGRTISGVRTDPDGGREWTFIYAPGAGSNIHDAFGRSAAGQLAAAGVATVRFQFPYMEAGKRSPDRPAVLEETWRAVIETVRPGAPKLVAGGRSMGGRIASQVVAEGVPVDALALFAYPLHPPGKPEQRRDAHLASLRVPVFFCSGTNDAFASSDELREAAALIPNARVYLLEGSDHGFNVPRSSGRRKEDVWEQAVVGMLEWLRGAA